MKLLAIIRMIISFLTIVFGAYLSISSPNKSVAKTLVTVGVISFIIDHIRWIIARRNANNN
jgi:hypothetical protein